MPKNHFTTLGLKVGAAEEDVKKAYRALAKKWHPDKNPTPGAEDKFKEIGAAYEYLQSNDRRELLARELSKSASKPAAKTSSPKSSSTAHPSSPKQSHHWNYKGTEKTAEPPPAGSSSSAKMGSSKQNRHPGTSKKSSKSPHWSESFHKKKTAGKSGKGGGGGSSGKSGEWKPWGGTDWDEDIGKGFTPQYSDAFDDFKSFVDKMGGPQCDTAFFFGTDDVVFGVFGDQEFFRPPGGLGVRPGRGRGRGKPKRDPRNVASEHGYSGGLDEDLLFQAGRGKQKDGADKAAKCPVCQKVVTLAALARHEKYCGRFDAPSDWENDNDDDEEEKVPFRRGRVFFSSDEDDDVNDYYDDDDDFVVPPGKPKDGDWRDTHEDVLNKIRRDRKMYAANLKRQASEEGRCEWCGRTFKALALQRHLPVCKEHVMRYGRPMNPSSSANEKGPPPESKFARSRKYSESIPRPHPHASTSQQTSSGGGRGETEGEGERYSYSPSSSSPSPPPPPPKPSTTKTATGPHFSPPTGNARSNNARPSPPKAAESSKKTSPADAASGKGKSPTSSSSATKQSSKSPSTSGAHHTEGVQGQKFTGTGFKVNAGADTSIGRRTYGRGSKQ